MTERSRLASVGDFLREVVGQWQEDRALSLGAALAYYALFSMTPLLVLVIAVAGLALGRAAAQGEIERQVGGLMGPEGAKLVQDMVVRASQPASGILATAVSLVVMLFGASGVFGQLQASLNQIFRAPPRTGGSIRGMIRQRLSAFAMILGIGSLLWLSLLLSAVLAGVHEILVQYAPVLARVLGPANFALSLLVVTVLFAMVFKVLPDLDLGWRDVWLGAIVTALLFTLGKGLIGLYLGRAGTASVYGAAGSLVLVLLWIYYSAQILFLGAEFTAVYARRRAERLALQAPAS